MQISRHWRLNAQRYRLEGFRLSDGRVSIQARQPIAAQLKDEQQVSTVSAEPQNTVSVLSSVA